MGLEVGALAPDFVLNDADGTPFRLSDHLGTQPVVVFFYPRDFTPGCTAEACSFRDGYEDFVDAGALVVGISSDTERSHGRFAARLGLPFRLLSDEKGKVSQLYRVRKRFFNLLPGRETFVLDLQGRVVLVFDSPAAGGHMRKSLEAVKKLTQK